MSIRVLLAEDHHIIRQGIRSLLEKAPGLEVIGEATDGRETVTLARQLNPDVIVMDVSMPNMNGIEATRQICLEDPTIKVIALSVHSDDPFVSGMLMAGASGYLLKDCVLEELVQAIQTVAHDRLYLSSRITRNVVQDYRLMKSRELDTVFSTLTPREREVLQLIAEGLTSVQIGERLHIAASTVEVHRRNLMRKLDLHNVAELTRYAIHSGISPSTNAGAAG